ncbi:uncharacterized protein Bfra_009114 [Botrytis fragariae]|uniref:Uncharacterized protein n=1 Tax=Botrytis fragariae TaxID=1964551 RepID=A0A8H6EHH8_9HELO|nr:uncharacterized protein Bfra_009114 [Botrytis fragariae]KAF5872085.1 hypothetical protein Bfra_009114 [Botrytis fragariae]
MVKIVSRRHTSRLQSSQTFNNAVPLYPRLSPFYREQPQYRNRNLARKRRRSCRIRNKFSNPAIPSLKHLRDYIKTAGDILKSWNYHAAGPDDSDIDEDFVDELKYFINSFEYFVVNFKIPPIIMDISPDLKERATEFKPEDCILERLPTEVREMIFVFCGRSTFCSADQGPRLLKALRGQRRAYTHALTTFERLNSYELGAELRNHTSKISYNVHDMTGLMAVNKASRIVPSQLNSNDLELAESDLKLTLYGRIHEDLKYYGDFSASTPSTVLCGLVRQLHSANRIRDVQFSQELSLTRERSSRIILCQADQGDWTFLKNFLTLVPYRRVKRVIIQLPNPENYCVNAAPRYDIYYRDNHYESCRAKQDAFVLAVIECINQKVGVRGIVLGRSKDNLSGFCMWEAPEGRYMDWHRDVIESWALRGGFGKTFLDYENNFFELREDTSRRCFVVRNRHE